MEPTQTSRRETAANKVLGTLDQRELDSMDAYLDSPDTARLHGKAASALLLIFGIVLATQ